MYWYRIFMKRVSTLVLAIFFCCLLIAPLSAVQAAGASLSFSPSSAAKNVGDSFSIKVMVNSGGGQGINASDATITFDKDLLSIKSVSKDGSIFNMWQTEPTFSNSGGTINYSGGKTPPAYTGTAGTLMTINFTALKVGEAVIKFSAASVLAADGQGTNVLSGTSQAKITISEKPVEQKPETKPTTKPTTENKPTTETKPTETNSGIIPPPLSKQRKSH